MRLRRPAARLAAWLAITAMALATLAPSAARWLGGSTGAAVIEICTAVGMRTIDAPTDNAPGAHLPEHCPWCALQAHALAPPPPAAAPAFATFTFEAPRAFLAAPHTLHAWRSAQPRGPPTFS